MSIEREPCKGTHLTFKMLDGDTGETSVDFHSINQDGL